MPSPPSRLGGHLTDRAPPLLLAAMVTIYCAVFGWLTWHQQANYGTFGFDMGIHDQGIWLLSRLRTPFVTVRGLHYFGHHLNLVSLLLVPLYWLGAGPAHLYLVETVALAAGAVPVYLLARDRLEAPMLALVPAAAYLLYPSVGWVNWWHFHPETLAVAPLLLSVWLASRRRWGWFALCVGLALSTKEDIALAVAVLGLVLAWRVALRPGLITAAAGAGWYVVATQVVMPAFNGGAQPFYAQEFFPQFGDSTTSVVLGMLTNPGLVWDLLTERSRIEYYLRLLGPNGFLALLGLPFLLIAGPQLAANSLTPFATAHDFRFHYTVVPIAAIFVATVEGLALLRRWGRAPLHVGLVVLVLAAAVNHRVWSPSPLGRQFDSGIWAKRLPRHDLFDRAVASVPAGAGVSASYSLIPHLTHRPRAYEWPNPWRTGNWGIGDRDPHDPAAVDYLVLDLALDQETGLLSALIAPEGDFEVLSDQEGVLLARRR
ncbi:MAG: DUF2079 domain-containing protein [Actinobacteria bacterium]|nr:DUF2079 domain-containing protein [Actinomycetota bacterium]